MSDDERSRSEQPEDEGIPDLSGPPPKGPAGETEEGMMLPHDEPRAAEDHGTTAAEQREGKELGDRLDEERADRRERPGSDTGRLLEEGDGVRDVVKDEVAEEAEEDTAGRSAEELAMRREENPAGLGSGSDGYVEDDDTEGSERRGA